jgi:hypothetical protein
VSKAGYLQQGRLLVVALYHTMYLGCGIIFGIGGGINKFCNLCITQTSPMIGVGKICLFYVVKTGVIV